MANSTRSSCKTIEENSRGRQSGGGGGSDMSLSIESSGLRRSTRDTTCKKTITPKKSTSQQLGQTNKQVATSPVTRSLAKKVTASGPLRTSKRSNKQSSSSKSSEFTAEISSRSPELNNKKRKVERSEKTLKQSMIGTTDATKNVNREYDSGRAKRIRMTRRYKALFRTQEKQVKVSGKYEELASPSKSPAKDGSNSGGCISKERVAAVESGQVTATKSLPRKETAENLYEEESTQINQTKSAGQVVIQDTAYVDEPLNEKIHSLPLLSVPELREIDISRVAELPEVADSSTKEKGNYVDVYEERIVEGRADATAIAVCKDNASVDSPLSHQENHVGESTTVNMSRKSGKLEDGVDIRLDKHSDQISVHKLSIQGNDAVADVEQLPGCSAFGRKTDSSKFMEYWVPAQLSHLQLEKYCSVLLSSSGSLTLRSSLKSDILGALGNILADIRKCCDHPYLLDKDKDNSLDNFLKSLELTQLLDIGIQASGKLDLLVKFLVEMRTRGMRTLILFQSISNSGKDPKSSGDILDDLMRQKFGVDSYERVDAGLVRAKVQTALNNFNDKKLGRFAFLLEGRACRPSIKLSSVDLVIVFTSDLNPANDIRNLQKLTLDSKSEKLKVFRLFSCFTVEEKVLINAMQRVGMDGRLDEINSLLRWGASYLFDRLKKFHCNTDESSKLIISDPLHADDVVKELIYLLSVAGDNNIRNSSMIVRVQQNAGVYSTECPLVGESKNNLSMEKLPHIFWADLLEGKYPSWRYLSNSGQRNRKRLQNSDGLHVEQGDNIDQTGKKRIKFATDNDVHKKLADHNGVQSSTKLGKEEGKTASSNMEVARSYPLPPENGASNSMVECDEARRRLNAQRSLLCILQPDVSRLCEVLNLTDDVKQKTDIFLSYVVNNHQVDREPKSILQAFLLALCWTAASLSKVKANHKELFELAKDRLNYCCEWSQAEYVYTMMRSLKEMFLNKTQILEAEDDRAPSSNTSQSAVFCPVNRQVNLEDNIPLVQDNPSKSDVYDLNKLAGRNIQKIKNKTLKRMRKLLFLHEKERNKICSTFEEAKANLDKEHRIEAAVVRSLHGEGPTRTDKLNALESEYNRKVEDHKNQMLASLSELERAHIDDRTTLQLKEASLIEELSEWVRTKLLKKSAESAGGGETCFSDSDGPDIIKLNGARASAAPEEAPDAAGAPEALSEARAPEEAPSEAGTHEEDPAAAKAPDAVGASKEAPNEVRAPEETPAAANAPDAAGAPEEAPNEARSPEEAPAAAKASEEAPDAAVSPQDVSGAPLAVISASESPSNPVMRSRLSSKSIASLLVPGLLVHHVGANRLDQDRENVSVGPCPSESIPNGATPSLPGDEIPLNEHQNTYALVVENAEQDNLPPQERDVPSETSSLPRREGPPNKESISRFPDHVVPIDAHSEDMQIDCHLEGTVATHEETFNVPDGEAATDIGSIDLQAAQHLTRDISDNHIVGDVPSRLNNISLFKDIPISEVNVRVSDATSADEQDVSGNPNQQEPRPDGCGNSTLPQLVDISPQDDSVLQSLPEKPQNQSNVGSTSSRTHNGNGSSAERPNAPTQVSMPMVSRTTNYGQAQPDQPASNAGQTERILDMQNIPDLSPVIGTAQPPSTNGCTSLNFPELRQVPDPVEASRPLAHAVHCTVNTQATYVPTNSIASGSGIGSMQPSLSMPSGKSDSLQMELDKIRKQMDHSIRNLEETKKQLEVGCQKEIAEIRQKFAVKVQESEAEYVSEKNELETNLQKVVMSKVLAAAFRYKCMDPKKAGTPATNIRPPDIRSSSQPWITSAASVHRLSSSSMNPTSAAAATCNSQSITQPTSVIQPRAPDATSNSQSINPPTAVVPPWAPPPVRPPPLVKALHRSPLLPSSHRPLVTQGQKEHLQSASRPLSHGVAPRSIPPPPEYQPRAVTQTGASSSVANRIGQVSSRIPQPPNVHDRLHFIANTPNAAQPSNFHFPPVNINITTTTTTTTSFSEVRPSGERSNGSAIIDAPNIIELSDEE